MSKRLLMLSTATAALVTGAAFATDTTITDSKTDPYTTGALLTSNTGTASAGNVTIKSGGSVAVSGVAQGAVTIDSNNWLLQQGTLSNKDKDGASAIHVDMSTNPDFTGTSIPGLTGGGSTAVPTGIYLDANSMTSVSGSGSSKFGIYLDTAACTAVCTFKGAITLASGSILDVTGDKSAAIQIGTASGNSNIYGVLKGDLIVAGTVSATAATTDATATGMYGLVSYGKIDGNLNLTGSITAYGHGATGMLITGQGITGSLAINGALSTSILSSQTNYNPNQKINTTTNPEAGPALEIGASIGGGVYIAPSTGNVSSTGASPAVLIGSAVATAQAGPIVLGVYGDSSDPGFSFYNRGAISANFSNYNKPSIAVQLGGLNTNYQTILSGGFYTSGTIAASATTSNDATSSSGIYAFGLVVGDYVKLLPNDAVKAQNTPTSPGDQAALVVAGSSSAGGTISVAVSGTRGGLARAVYVASTASVPSLINFGTISATVQTTDAALAGGASGNDPVAAVAIQDDSGTLTSVINSGTIAAQAGYGTSYSPLDNNSQIAIAVQFGSLGNSLTGATVRNVSYGKVAQIHGSINFGDGNNKVLELISTSGFASKVVGNVVFGHPTGSTSGDRIHIGENGILSGKILTSTSVETSGVQVDIDTNGTLNLLNTTAAMNATSFNVATGGTLFLGVNRQLTSSGMIAAQSVNFASGSNLGVTYASFVPQASHQFVLMTANNGQLQIGQSTLDQFNTATNRPYLLQKATMCVATSVAVAGCTRPTDILSTKDALLIDVVMKGAVDPNPSIADHLTDPTVDANTGVHTANYIGLTANSVAVSPLAKLNCTVTSTNTCVTTLFEQANLALAIDDDLGAAFINGIHNAKDAAKAYNDMAPGVTGGTRAIAISITDQATGPVASRQRALRMYGKASGDFTVWGQEFVQMIKDPGSGAIDPNTGFKTNPGFKDHGFGMSVGIDGGSPKSGWYGGAITFYAGDVNELARSAHQNQQWYVASLYSVWRGKGLFFDAKVDAGYGNIDGKRTLVLQPTSTTYTARQATNKHAGALLSGGFSTGGMFSYGAATFMPQLSVDGLYVREEGYTEKNPGTTTLGDGFDLKVNQSYAKSLRAFLGLDVRYDLKLWDFYLQPEARAGYRYDFINDPAKIKAAFAYADTTGAVATAGQTFELTGPDPSQGNFVLGASLAASADTWTLGLNFDLVKGSNGAFQQVATVHLLGRI